MSDLSSVSRVNEVESSLLNNPSVTLVGAVWQNLQAAFLGFSLTAAPYFAYVGGVETGVPSNQRPPINTNLSPDTIAGFSQKALARIDELKNLLAAALNDGIEEVGTASFQTWAFAIQNVGLTLVLGDLPMPEFTLLQGGGLGVEWHEADMNIELRFRSPYKVYCDVEDARSQTVIFSGSDPYLHNSLAAIHVLACRMREKAVVV